MRNLLHALLLSLLALLPVGARAGYFSSVGSYTSSCYLTLGMAVESYRSAQVGGSAATITAVDISAFTVTFQNNQGARTISWGVCNAAPAVTTTPSFVNGVIDPAFSNDGTSLTPGDLARLEDQKAQIMSLQAQVQLLSQQVVSVGSASPGGDVADPFDPELAAQVFGFFFTTTLALWYLSLCCASIVKGISY